MGWKLILCLSDIDREIKEVYVVPKHMEERIVQMLKNYYQMVISLDLEFPVAIDYLGYGEYLSVSKLKEDGTVDEKGIFT